MRKFYAFFAAALISLGAFASADVIPSDEILADYYDEGDVCVCFFVPADIACNAMVVTGSFNGWSSAVASCAEVEEVEGYEGWYVASFTPEEEPSEADGICAKPIMLDADGNFNWEYQIGAATAIRGGATVVQGSYAGEIDIKHYGTDAPNVFLVDAWKKNPCEAVYHDYVVTVISDGCGGLVVPYIIGAMNGWTAQQLQLDVDASQANEVPTYALGFKAAEGTPYQILSGMMNPETGLVPAEGDSAAGWKDIAYLEVLVDGIWSRYEKDNSATGAEANIVYDLRVDTMRWARCDDSPMETVNFSIKLPAENLPEAGVEIIGGFDNWEGTAMALNAETGAYEAIIEAKASQFFKIRSAGSWDQELEIYNEEEDAWAKIGDGQLIFGQLWEGEEGARTIALDYSDAEKYRWSEAPEEGIENVVLTEKAQKVMVDGVLYIVRDNKLFNVQGVQVR